MTGTQPHFQAFLGSKATLSLTIPHHIFKSSVKDFAHRSMEIVLQGDRCSTSTVRALPMTGAPGVMRPLLADIEGSKSNVVMNAWLPQTSYLCGNFSNTSSFKFQRSKGSLGHALMVRIRTGN
ncbi:Hypothetical predicted protein [Olea europaea subsp. europaea]|uniref:Senescence-associated protein n=1 Tax=Olea europaea subsp. europaea TaxID=158383 RepID=A0A8S0T9U3_OLEEU|nr:Hypothetical predicted protein [Olea europaea subsp. europaea]